MKPVRILHSLQLKLNKILKMLSGKHCLVEICMAEQIKYNFLQFEDLCLTFLKPNFLTEDWIFLDPGHWTEIQVAKFL